MFLVAKRIMRWQSDAISHLVIFSYQMGIGELPLLRDPLLYLHRIEAHYSEFIKTPWMAFGSRLVSSSLSEQVWP